MNQPCTYITILLRSVKDLNLYGESSCNWVREMLMFSLMRLVEAVITPTDTLLLLLLEHYDLLKTDQTISKLLYHFSIQTIGSTLHTAASSCTRSLKKYQVLCVRLLNKCLATQAPYGQAFGHENLILKVLNRMISEKSMRVNGGLKHYLSHSDYEELLLTISHLLQLEECRFRKSLFAEPCNKQAGARDPLVLECKIRSQLRAMLTESGLLPRLSELFKSLHKDLEQLEMKVSNDTRLLQCIAKFFWTHYLTLAS